MPSSQRARRCGLRVAFVVALRCVRRCWLRIGFVAVRTPLWVAHCFCRIRQNIVYLQHFVALRCVRRCWLRIAFVAVRTPLWVAYCLVASERTSSICSISCFCGAYAAVGCALPSLQCARRCGLRIAFVASDRSSYFYDKKYVPEGSSSIPVVWYNSPRKWVQLCNS